MQIEFNNSSCKKMDDLKREKEKGRLKYTNTYYGFPVVTRQETAIRFNPLISIKQAGEDALEVEYGDQAVGSRNEALDRKKSMEPKGTRRSGMITSIKRAKQQTLF